MSPSAARPPPPFQHLAPRSYQFLLSLPTPTISAYLTRLQEAESAAAIMVTQARAHRILSFARVQAWSEEDGEPLLPGQVSGVIGTLKEEIRAREGRSYTDWLGSSERMDDEIKTLVRSVRRRILNKELMQ